jgi:oxygen-independent coproporphyrinogen-3 oxidase
MRKEPSERYLKALQKEIALHAQNGTLDRREIVSLYLGGGTPTLYPPAVLNEVISLCREAFRLQPNAEITIEAHPATMNEDTLTALLNGGVNRLSIGVQSFSDEMLTLLGRHHSVNDAMTAFHAARRAGFSNISIDLIYALPGESLSDWEKTLQMAIDLNPEHLSLYCLSIDEGTLFHKRGVTLPSEEEQISQYQWAQNALSNAGFKQYEISNFAKEGFACVHNTLYWDRAETLGIGLSAHSYLNDQHQENTDSLSSYCEAIEQGRTPIQYARTVGIEEAQADRIIFGLRKREGIKKVLLHPSQKQQQTAAALIDSGLLIEEQDRICLTPRGMLLADQVAEAFL